MSATQTAAPSSTASPLPARKAIRLFLLVCFLPVVAFLGDRLINGANSPLLSLISQQLSHCYQRFPSPGQNDWLLLFLVLAFVVRLIFLPYLWNAIRQDMMNLAWNALQSKMRLPVLSKPTNQDTSQTLWSFLWTVVWGFLLFSLFTSNQGQTLLAGRGMNGLMSATRPHFLFWSGSVGVLGLLGLTSMCLTVLAKSKGERSGQPVSPYRERSFLSLYSGGGHFPSVFSFSTCEIITAFAAQVAYSGWDVWVIMLMDIIVLTGLGTEAIRLLFVYLQHKRTFG